MQVENGCILQNGFLSFYFERKRDTRSWSIYKWKQRNESLFQKSVFLTILLFVLWIRLFIVVTIMRFL
jgi:hypothetical protein